MCENFLLVHGSCTVCTPLNPVIYNSLTNAEFLIESYDLSFVTSGNFCVCHKFKKTLFWFVHFSKTRKIELKLSMNEETEGVLPDLHLIKKTSH